jgi:uncharacterized membrane protein
LKGYFSKKNNFETLNLVQGRVIERRCKYRLLDCFVLVALAMTFFFNILPAFAGDILDSQIGKVQSVESYDMVSPSTMLDQKRQIVEIELLSGEDKGETVVIENTLMGNPAFDIELKGGDKIILHVENDGVGGKKFFAADKYRAGGLLFLAGLFSFLLVIIGGRKGVSSLVSIAVTLSLIFWGLTPMVLSGINPIAATVLICIIAAISTLYLVGGLNYKSTSAILGTVLSLAIGGALAILSIKIASLTGFSSEETTFLFSANPELNFVGILASAMIIGALGAVMDIGMSISSTINELYKKSPYLSVKELFESGMNVGQDIIGTMANTLILAYLGGALALVLLSSNIDLQKFFNLNQVATEIAAALIGSIAIVVCVPISAIIAAYLVRKTPQNDEEENVFDGIINE